MSKQVVLDLERGVIRLEGGPAADEVLAALVAALAKVAVRAGADPVRVFGALSEAFLGVRNEAEAKREGSGEG